MIYVNEEGLLVIENEIIDISKGKCPRTENTLFQGCLFMDVPKFLIDNANDTAKKNLREISCKLERFARYEKDNVDVLDTSGLPVDNGVQVAAFGRWTNGLSNDQP